MSSLLIYLIPVIIYGVAVCPAERAGCREVAKRLGLVPGKGRYYIWAVGLAVATAVLPVLVIRMMGAEVLGHENIALSRFIGQSLTVASLLSAVSFGVLETGLGEELLFRGLIAGALGRRMRLWAANVIQAAIFVLPHLLLVSADTRLWPLAVPIPLASGLILGWLRLESGSILPGWIVHALGNIISAIAVIVFV